MLVFFLYIYGEPPDCLSQSQLQSKESDSIMEIEEQLIYDIHVVSRSILFHLYLSLATSISGHRKLCIMQMKHSLNNTVKIKVVNMIFLGVHPRTTILFLAIKPTKHSVKSFSVNSVNINVSRRLNILCERQRALYGIKCVLRIF